MTNPILSDWNTPFEIAPFAEISDDDFAPALDQAMHAHNAQIEAIASNEDAATFANTIEALEAAIARTEDQWEPDGESDDAYSGTRTTSMNWSEEVESSEPFEDEDDTAEELDAAQDPEFVTEEVDVPVTFIRDPSLNVRPVAEEMDEVSEIDARLIDEAALQDLVAQVVRQELQGALGERITRNVRKMVRREINRALAEQDLD